MAGPSVTLFGPIDALVGPYAEYVVLVLALTNLVTRKLAHDAHVRQAADGEDAISRHPAHVATSVLLVLSAFYYTTLHQHAGIVLSMLVLGVFISDFFEFEARKLEARNDMPIETPNAALVASAVMLLYAAYISLFFLVEGYWNAIV